MQAHLPEVMQQYWEYDSEGPFEINEGPITVSFKPIHEEFLRALGRTKSFDQFNQLWFSLKQQEAALYRETVTYSAAIVQFQNLSESVVDAEWHPEYEDAEEHLDNQEMAVQTAQQALNSTVNGLRQVLQNHNGISRLFSRKHYRARKDITAIIAAHEHYTRALDKQYNITGWMVEGE